jgi:hypothetical protein
MDTELIMDRIKERFGTWTLVLRLKNSSTGNHLYDA